MSPLPSIVALAAAAQAEPPTQHDMLDASMFWVGLLMALTPLVLIGSVVAYIWWSRRRRNREPAQEP